MTGPGVEFDWKFFKQLSTFGIVFISVITLALYGCECENNKPKVVPKYKQGDVVWLKPDSTRAVVSEAMSSDYYNVHYYDNKHEAQSINVPEYGIYSKVNQ